MFFLLQVYCCSHVPKSGPGHFDQTSVGIRQALNVPKSTNYVNEQIRGHRNDSIDGRSITKPFIEYDKCPIIFAQSWNQYENESMPTGCFQSLFFVDLFTCSSQNNYIGVPYQLPTARELNHVHSWLKLWKEQKCVVVGCFTNMVVCLPFLWFNGHDWLTWIYFW